MSLFHQNKFEKGSINGAYVPNKVFDRQEHQREKLRIAFRNRPVFLETKIEPAIVNKPVIKKQMMNSNLPTSPNRIARRKVFDSLKNSNREDRIGQQYLSDCGISTHWVYKCAPWKELPICVENESDGAWVPFMTLYREDYFECLYVKEQGQGRQFSQDHGLDYN